MHDEHGSFHTGGGPPGDQPVLPGQHRFDVDQVGEDGQGDRSGRLGRARDAGPRPRPSAAVLAVVRFQTVSEPSAASRRRAMGSPIRPRPSRDTDGVVMRCGPESSRSARRAGSRSSSAWVAVNSSCDVARCSVTGTSRPRHAARGTSGACRCERVLRRLTQVGARCRDQDARRRRGVVGQRRHRGRSGVADVEVGPALAGLPTGVRARARRMCRANTAPSTVMSRTSG